MRALLLVALSLAGLASTGAPVAAQAPAPGLERDPFQSSVAEALQAGRSYLARSVRNAGLRSMYPLGQRALYAYALIEAGRGPRDPLLEQLFDEMEQLPLAKTYSVAAYAMALDASLRREPQEWKEERHTPRRRLLEGCLDWLVEARYRDRGLWGYEKLGRGGPGIADLWVDFSATQFAVLGLQVGLRNGFKIPADVFEEIVGSHVRQAQPMASGMGRILCEGGGWWTDSTVEPRDADKPSAIGRSPVLFTSTGFAIQGVPRGWPYRPAWNRRDRDPGRTSYSMTGAAVSSLIVAREGLARAGRLRGESLERVDRLIAEGMLTLRRDLESLTPSDLDNLLRNYYYTLYSFEKAMDLGGVVVLGGIDWYREQARVLMTTQRSDGAWGYRTAGIDAHYDRVSTAFALLFLCRATRNLRIEPPDPILTALRDGDEATGGVTSGRVYLPSRQGMVGLAELFGMLADTRTPDLLAAAREIVDSVAPEEVPELLPYLVELRDSGVRDSVHAFADEAVAGITGLPGATPAAQVLDWLRRWRELVAWGKAGDVARLDAVQASVRDAAAGVPLRLVAIDAILKIASLEGVPALLDGLEAAAPEVREASHRALMSLTLKRIPFEAGGTPEERGTAVARWRALWSDQGAELLFRQRWGKLRSALERAADLEQRARLRAAIIALGERAVPEIDAILRQRRHAFDWVLIREAITGERPGF